MESLCFRSPPTSLIGGSSPPIGLGIDIRTGYSPSQVNASGRPIGGNTVAAAVETTAAVAPASQRSYMFPRPLRRLWPGGGEKGNNEEIPVPEDGEEERDHDRQQGNWVLKILRVRSIWAGKREERGAGDGVLQREETGGDGGGGGGEDARVDEGVRCVGCHNESDGCEVAGEENAVEINRDSFSRLLDRASLADSKLYAQLSYLGNMAYTIPKINPASLLKHHGLRFVTSSLEQNSKYTDPEKDTLIHRVGAEEEKADVERQRKNGHMISAAAAYQIAASAASFVQSQMKNILPFRSTEALAGADFPERETINIENSIVTNSDVASFVVTTDSVTAMVAAKEETKQAVAKDLNSAHCSPCEWFICDDDKTRTRFFAIQGSESLASWQANLLFEPVQFEGLDVLVHRGIYEAAKGIYEQMLPEVRAHLRSHGDSATLRFTGHSLGGSLALLVNLMLLIRREASPSSLLPVITFGSPCIMCGGNYLLRKLGLPPSHAQAITMHRDIVPRAFSCSYPDYAARILQAINVKFRDHPCLKHQKFLYAPMGELLILQPDEKFSPHHHLLPSGSGLYILGRSLPDSNGSLQLVQFAQSVFLNSPHPLETLSDPSAYGSGGIIYRDHDMKAYVRAVRGVVHQELKRIRKNKREHRRKVWWSIAVPHGIAAGIITGQQARFKSSGPREFNFSGIFQGGRDSLKRFGRLVASRHVHMLVVLLLPSQLLLLGSLTVISFS